MMYEIPTSVEILGAWYEIRSDYRAALDICTALTDIELDEQDRTLVVLGIFYPTFSEMPLEHYQEAIQRCLWFIRCGEEELQQRAGPLLMSWEDDFKHIVAPVNRVLGAEVRAKEYLHWWTFISAYYEIGDCLFAQIVRIRDLLARGKPLDKADQEWYRKNRGLVDSKSSYTKEEESVVKLWTK